MPRAESIEAAMLVAKAAEKRRLFITMSFPSVARSSPNLLRGLVSLDLSGVSSIWCPTGLVAGDVANVDRLLLPFLCASDDTRAESRAQMQTAPTDERCLSGFTGIGARLAEARTHASALARRRWRSRRLVATFPS